MKKVLSLTTLMAGAMMVFNAAAADAPKELNLGILGGQNATQQIGDNQCVKQRSEEHTSEIQSLSRISYAVLCLKKKKKKNSYQPKS